MYLNKKRNIGIVSFLIFTSWILYINSLRFFDYDIAFPDDFFNLAHFTKDENKLTYSDLPEKRTGIKTLDTVYNIKTETGMTPSTGPNTVNSINSPFPGTTHSNQSQAIIVNQTKKTVYLTFDDGPKPFSPEILSILSQFGAKATFFLIDGNIRAFPDAVRQMVASGHAVASHSVSHRTEQFYQSSQTVISEMQQTRNTIREVTGVDSSLIRTPYGSAPYMTEEYKQSVAANGLQMWDWNIDSKDWYFRDQRLVHTVIAQVEAKKDSSTPLVILLHEQPETLVHLPALLQYLTSQQFDMQALNPSIPPVQF